MTTQTIHAIMTTVTGSFPAAVVLSAVLAGCSPSPDPPPSTPDGKPLVAFLCRHAEKVDDSRDAELSVAGKARAEELAMTLRSAGIEHVHSSDFIRARETGAPTADRFGLEMELYDPGDLSALAGQLLAAGGVHLVVGHSNTTPRLAELLGGEAGPPIDEPAEYDRLYIVTVGADGSANSVLVRYGAPFFPEAGAIVQDTAGSQTR